MLFVVCAVFPAMFVLQDQQRTKLNVKLSKRNKAKAAGGAHVGDVGLELMETPTKDEVLM